MNEPHKCMSAGTVEAAMRWIYENDRIECFDCDPPHGAEIIHVGHQKTIARGPSAMKAKEALAMLSAAQATLWPDIKQLHDAIAECIGREGLTYSGIRRAAKRVQELYAATIAARPAAAPVDQERLAELQNEAGMYKSLYENAIAQRSSAGSAELADWSRLPRDLYVTSVKSSDGIVYDVQCCSVPMAIGPEVRYTQAAAEPQTPSNREGGK
jgi:hypothetical protein